MQLPATYKMKNIICAALLAAAASAHASSYFVVIPVPGRAAAAQAIQVDLAGYALPGAVAGVVYDGFNFNQVLRVTGDPAFNPGQVSWSVASGSLPAGMSLSRSGVLTGTPAAAGTSSVTVKALYKTKSGEQAYELVTVSITVALASANLPNAQVGEPYSQDLKPLLSVSGDSSFTPGAVTWSVVSSTLPEGLALRTSGVISGTPTAGGAGSVTVRATYRGKSGEQTYEVLTLNIQVALGSAELPVAQVGASYSYDFKPLAAVTGDPDYRDGSVTWSMAGAPAGLTLSPAGVLTGTVPAFAGTTAPVAVTAQYKDKAAQRTYNLTQERDPYWAQTVALLRMEGSPGSASFVDLKGGVYASKGATISAAGAKFGQSGYFPGGNGVGVVGPNFSLPGDFTIEAWVNPSSKTYENTIHTILGQWLQQIGNGAYILGVTQGALHFYFYPHNYNAVPLLAGPTLPADTWSHVAVTRNGTAFKMFVNGSLVQTAQWSDPGPTVSAQFALGDYFASDGQFGALGASSFAGFIDEVRVTAGVARYNADFAPSHSPFPAR